MTLSAYAFRSQSIRRCWRIQHPVCCFWTVGLLVLALLLSPACVVPVLGESAADNGGGGDGGFPDTHLYRMRFGAAQSRMPCLFEAEDAIYDTYAACLAATEGLRRGMLSQEDTSNSKTSQKEYVRESSKVLAAMGMSVDEYNDVGERLLRDPQLKEKIIQQAKLYRIGSLVSMDRVPVLSHPRTTQMKHNDDTLRKFCQSMTEMETLRLLQQERLRQSVQNADTAPWPQQDRMFSDPQLWPFLDPKVRSIVEDFPRQAESVVEKYGLDPDAFNALLDQTKTDAKFRRKVEKMLQTTF